MLVSEKGKDRERKASRDSSAGLFCSCAERCQTLLPAEMTLGTRPSCANTAALLNTHSRLSWAKSNYLPCRETFISVAHIQSPSSLRTSCAARLHEADKRPTVGSFSSVLLLCEHFTACQLNFSPSCSCFSPKKLRRDSRYQFSWKENHQSQQGGDARLTDVRQSTQTAGHREQSTVWT